MKLQQYKGKALDEKIHSFLARKLQDYPELDTVDHEPKHSKRIMRERSDVMHTFMPTKLKMQF